ncbi:MAG: cellulose synthase/poly-beta-1,6-N-acetylglucosamine synthase-like glycosyltransferase [Acidimicrobiales bacterium]
MAIRDGDELMEPDVLSLCLAEVSRSSGNVVAVGASILPSNDCVVRADRVVETGVSRNLWVGMQTIEYLVAFFLTRPGMAELGVLPFVSGGFGMFRRQSLIDVGGLVPNHLGEDLEVCLQIHEFYLERGLPYEIRHVPEAIVWTQLPNSHELLRRQRRRWQWGLQTAIQSHGKRLTEKTYGRIGRIGYGNIHVFEWWGPTSRRSAGSCWQ